MISLELTEDEDLIRSIVGHPDVRYKMLEEGEPVHVPKADGIYYLAIRYERHGDGAVDTPVAGIIAFIQVNSITWNPHIAILPAFQNFGIGTEAMQKAVRWMFDNTPCRKVVASPPDFQAPMLKVFERAGFRLEGRSPDSFLWHGQLHDRYLMGMEKD